MATLIIGVDLADVYFQLAIANVHFEIQQRRRLSRPRFAQFCHELPPSLTLMEACGSAHYWARTLQAAKSLGPYLEKLERMRTNRRCGVLPLMGVGTQVKR